MDGTPPLLRAGRLGKSFGAITVLSDVSLSLAAGEVHAVIGENGAGKSTLMKLLAGWERPSAGQILLSGSPIAPASPADAERLGIVLVPQEQLLAPDLSVAENLYLGAELRRRMFLDRAAMRGRTRALLDQLGCGADPDAAVARLSVAERQLVQVARALVKPHRVVILDEPTAVLTTVESAALFRAIARLTEAGVGVLYISHRLAEVAAIADRVTVLRDGRQVATHRRGELSEVAMARLMVGRELSAIFPPKPARPAGTPMLRVEGVTAPGSVADAGFALRAGEILGFAGLVGSGRTELFETLLGLRLGHIGGATRDASPLRLGSVRAAARAGIAYLTEDRKGKGLLLGHGLPMNATLMALDRVTRGPLIDRVREREATAHAVAEFDIRVRDPHTLAGRLSGGNQQKLLLAKVMATKPSILVLDEPTRGVDIGTKAQIYRFIADLAARGLGVVVISSEMGELIGLCHRILVMRAGRIVAELDGEDMNEDRIVLAATGVTREAA